MLALVIFSETGLLFGFVFPGDSLLLAGGLLASQGKFNIVWLIAVVIIASIAGYESGYYIGKKSGPRVFKRQDGLLFRHEYIERTQKFFKNHGGKTILLARFVPYVRTFVSVVAGVGGMDKRLYSIYNVLGGILWAGGLTLLSFWLGSNIPNFDKYILVTLVICFILFHAVLFWHLFHDKKRRQQFAKALREEWNYLFNRQK